MQGVLRLLAAVPLTGQPQPLGSLRGSCVGPGSEGTAWGSRQGTRGLPGDAEGGLLRRGAAPDKALSGEAGAGRGPGSQEGRWRWSEPKGGSGWATSAAFSFLPWGEEVCKADSEMAGMGRCRAATGPGLAEAPKSKGTERGPHGTAGSSGGGLSLAGLVTRVRVLRHRQAGVEGTDLAARSHQSPSVTLGARVSLLGDPTDGFWVQRQAPPGVLPVSCPSLCWGQEPVEAAGTTHPKGRSTSPRGDLLGGWESCFSPTL